MSSIVDLRTGCQPGFADGICRFVCLHTTACPIEIQSFLCTPVVPLPKPESFNGRLESLSYSMEDHGLYLTICVCQRTLNVSDKDIVV